MEKFIRKIVKTFKRLADANFFTFGKNVTASMAEVDLPFSAPTPSLTDVNTELENYRRQLQNICQP